MVPAYPSYQGEEQPSRFYRLSAESSERGNGAFTKARRVRALTEDRQNGRPRDEPDFAIAQVTKK
jgi:hypothetical protein